MKPTITTLLLLISTISFSQIPTYVPSNGLVGWWPFNGNANDESGNGNNGTVYGASLTADRFGIADKAYSFDGASNSIDCGPLSSIPSTVQDITQSAWVFAPSDQSTYCKLPIMSKRQVISEGWPSIGAGASNLNKAYYFVNAQNYSVGVSNTMFSNDLTNDGAWHMITGTKSGSIYKLYFDGVLQATYQDNYPLTANSNLIIGYEAMWGFNCERWYAGKLDDIGIWNRALTEAEIALLYAGCNLSISSQPQDQSVATSVGTASFSTSVSSTSATYQWQTNLGLGFQSLSNAGQYSGATSATLTISGLSISNNNQVFRCVINDSGCADTTAEAVLTIIDDASIQTHTNTSLQLYPNPVKDVMTLVGLKGEAVSFAVYSVDGKLIKSGKTSGEIQLEDLKKGNYILKIENQALPFVKL